MPSLYLFNIKYRAAFNTNQKPRLELWRSPDSKRLAERIDLYARKVVKDYN